MTTKKNKHYCIFKFKKQMRTKHLLFAMALPIAFAACTSDEFPETGSTVARGTLENIAIAVEDGASTRFAWENNAWTYETGDKFGAGVADPTLGTIANTYISNYVYTKQSNGKYSTTSTMTEGTYQFYSYPGFESKDSRSMIAFDLGEQIWDSQNPTKVVEDNQLFFSPLYELKAGEDNSTLQVTMYPYWAVAAFNIKNTSGKPFTLNQVVLNSGASQDFTVGGYISPEEVGKTGKYIYKLNDEGVFELPENVEIDNNAKTSAFWTSAFAATTDVAGNTLTPKKSKVVVVSCGKTVLANGESVVVYMNVPVGKYTNLSANIVFTDENGNAKQFDLTATEVVGIDKQDLKHGVTKAIFGLTTDKQMKAYSITAEDVKNATPAGHYISSKADFMTLLNGNHGTLEIYNMGNWGIDKEVADAITLYSGAGITFENEIEIDTEDACELPSKVHFKKGLVVASGEATLNASEVTGSINVAAGATLTLNEGTYAGVKLTNEGTLNLVNVPAANNSNGFAVTSTGALNNYSSKINGQITIKSGSLLLAMDEDLTTENYQTIPNIGTADKDHKIAIEIAEDVTVGTVAATVVSNEFVTLTNNGTITTLADNAGTVVNNGTIKTVTNKNGVITNNGVISALTANKGYIEMGSKDAELKGNANVNAGIINNTLGGWINGVTSASTPAKGYIYAEASKKPSFVCDLLVVNGGSIEEGDISGVDALILGSVGVNGEVTADGTWYVGLAQASTDKNLIEIAKKISGKNLTETDATKKAANFAAMNGATKLTFYETTTLGQGTSGYVTLENAASVLNRNNTQDAINISDDSTVGNWEGEDAEQNS